eukprot:COSAG01_NODE_1668_length_9563_cov_23.675613_1_plen_45_part_00
MISQDWLSLTCCIWPPRRACVGGRGQDGLDPQWAAVIHNGLRKL